MGWLTESFMAVARESSVHGAERFSLLPGSTKSRNGEQCSLERYDALLVQKRCIGLAAVRCVALLATQHGPLVMSAARIIARKALLLLSVRHENVACAVGLHACAASEEIPAASRHIKRWQGVRIGNSNSTDWIFIRRKWAVASLSPHIPVTHLARSLFHGQMRASMNANAHAPEPIRCIWDA